VSHLTVYKYELPITSAPSEVIPLDLPKGARLLKVGEQGADPMLGPRLFVWALIDPAEKETERRYVLTAGTGHQIELTALNRSWALQETVLCLGGRLVLHVWITHPEASSGSSVEQSKNTP